MRLRNQIWNFQQIIKRGYCSYCLILALLDFSYRKEEYWRDSARKGRRSEARSGCMWRHSWRKSRNTSWSCLIVVCRVIVIFLMFHFVSYLSTGIINFFCDFFVVFWSHSSHVKSGGTFPLGASERGRVLADHRRNLLQEIWDRNLPSDRRRWAGMGNKTGRENSKNWNFYPIFVWCETAKLIICFQ